MFGRRSTSTTRSTATSRTTGSVADPMSPTGAKGNWKAKLNPKRLSPNQSNPALRAKVNDPTITNAEATEAQQVLRERGELAPKQSLRVKMKRLSNKWRRSGNVTSKTTPQTY